MCNAMLYNDRFQFLGQLCTQYAEDGSVWCADHSEIQAEQNMDPSQGYQMINIPRVFRLRMVLDVVGYFENRWEHPDEWQCSRETMERHLQWPGSNRRKVRF